MYVLHAFVPNVYSALSGQKRVLALLEPELQRNIYEFLSCVYLPACVYVYHMYASASRGQKRASALQELEL